MSNIPHNLAPTCLELLDSKNSTKKSIKQSYDGFHIIWGTSTGVLFITNAAALPSSVFHTFNVCGYSDNCLAGKTTDAFDFP